MAIKIVECVPNFSEARRPEVMEEILKEIRCVQGVTLLDQHSDLDHNRTVVTFVGQPEAVEEAAFRGIARASQLIDLNVHTGEHPRIGATDVVPFIPISDVTMQECVEMARRLGKRVAEELNIPVFMYEEAAIRADRRNLEDIRRGEFEGLKQVIAADPARTPDFGPAEMGSAGATVIGARQFLIAYNIFLTTPDVTIAEKIARRVRNSTGGFRYVKGMGVLVDGLAQVSMNLTNFKRSPMAQVTEFVRREAARYGTAIHHTELVGLIPNQALVSAARYYLQLDGMDNSQLLDSRIFDSMHEDAPKQGQTVQDFFDSVAEGTPAPGGGSAAAHTGSLAAALVSMNARLTIGKSKYQAVESECWQILEQAEALRTKLLAGVVEDSEAFNQILTARRLPKADEEQRAIRQEAIRKASLHAAAVPLTTAKEVLEVLRLGLRLAEIGNVTAITDAASGACHAKASFDSAALNVRINLLGYEEDAEAQALKAELSALQAECGRLMAELPKILSERAGL